MSRLSELQKVDATADELQRWWQDAVEQRSVAIARAEAAEAALAACQDELDDLMAQRDVAEQELAAREQPCECGIAHSGMLLHGNRYCQNCGHPVKAE